DNNSLPITNAVQPTAVTIGNPFNPEQLFNGFVTKFSSNATSIVYSTYYGGSVEDRICDIAVDRAGNLYGVGFTASTDFPVTNAIQATFGGGSYDGFAFKLGPGGTNIVYSTYLGGSGTDFSL